MLRIAIELPVDVAVVENPIKGFSERRLKAAFFNPTKAQTKPRIHTKKSCRIVSFGRLFLRSYRPKNRGKEGKAVCVFKYTHFCMFMRKKPQKI